MDVEETPADASLKDDIQEKQTTTLEVFPFCLLRTILFSKDSKFYLKKILISTFYFVSWVQFTAVVTEEKEEETEAQPEPEVAQLLLVTTSTDEGLRDKTKTLTTDMNCKNFKHLSYGSLIFLTTSL